MRVIVTGGAGFIGSHVVEHLLASGHEPIVIDDLSTGFYYNIPMDIRFFEVNVCDSRSVRETFHKVNPEAVIHLAGQPSVVRSIRDARHDATVNIVGTATVLHASVMHGINRFIFASSGGVLYGNVAKSVESDPLRPMSPYAISKLTCEKYLEFYSSQWDMKAVSLRYSNVYGPRQSPDGECGVVATFCKSLLNDKSPMLRDGGKSYRDYVHVTDAARATVLALTAQIDTQFTAINIGTGKPTLLNDLAESIRVLVGTQTGFTTDHKWSGELLSSCVDVRLAKQLLGWEPSIELQDGLKQTVEWYRSTYVENA